MNQWSRKIDVIMAMDTIVRRFNDEDWIEPWLSVGVPDGLEGRADYEDTYPNNASFDENYARLTALFCRLIARQTAYTHCSGVIISFNGDEVII